MNDLELINLLGFILVTIVLVIPSIYVCLVMLAPIWFTYYFRTPIKKEHVVSYTEFEKMFTNRSDDTLFDLDINSFVVNFSKINNESNKKEQKKYRIYFKTYKDYKKYVQFVDNFDKEKEIEEEKQYQDDIRQLKGEE